MDPRHDYPDFHRIRSHLERADAERGVEIGYALADAITDAGDCLGRAFKSVTQFIVALHKKT
jgi:hypothetical protein